MSSEPRTLSLALAINEALHQAMAEDDSVFLMGQGVKSPWYVGNTVQGLLERFGKSRVIDTPVSENGVTGAAVGAAICGMRPVVVHPRMDFMFYAMDPIINQAANWRYMNGGACSVPVVFWGILNRGGEQGTQHSQSLHSMLAHVPGLKVVMPATPFDAKGLMRAAIRDPDPVVFIHDRWLCELKGHVPAERYEVRIGSAAVARPGRDVTIVALSYMVSEACNAAEDLAGEGIEAEVIDLRSVKPYDRKTILASVRKTGRLLVCDMGWLTCGISAEIAAFVSERAFRFLKGPPARLALPDCPAPAARSLEEVYYPRAVQVAETVREMVGHGRGK